MIRKPRAIPFLALAFTIPLAILPVVSAHAQDLYTDTWIAFHSNRDAGGDHFQIYKIRPDGTDLTRLTNNADNEGTAVWSPDGSTIAFWSTRDDNGGIYLMNSDGTDQTRITCDPGGHATGSFSPDGNKLAFYSNRDGDNEIFVMNVDGTNVQQLTVNSYDEHYPVWSPDGSKIAFVSDRDGQREIYIMNSDGTNQTRLTQQSGFFSTHASWSPDGSKIAFLSATSTWNLEIYVMDADGANRTQLTANTRKESSPTWSPDGSKIAFLSVPESGNTYEIYLMNPDGTDQTRVTYDTGQDYKISWSPFVDPNAPGHGIIGCDEPLPVSIDIKPGSDPNCFNINGHGVVPVAILGSGDFDVAQVDPDSLTFDGLIVRIRGSRGPLCSFEDSNGDTHGDLVCHFEDDPEFWIGGGGTGTITGRLLDGTEIVGTDSVCVVP